MILINKIAQVNLPLCMCMLVSVRGARQCMHPGARRFVHNTIRTPDVSYTNHKNCNVSYTSFVRSKYRI